MAVWNPEVSVLLYQCGRGLELGLPHSAHLLVSLEAATVVIQLATDTGVNHFVMLGSYVVPARTLPSKHLVTICTGEVPREVNVGCHIGINTPGLRHGQGKWIECRWMMRKNVLRMIIFHEALLTRDTCK